MASRRIWRRDCGKVERDVRDDGTVQVWSAQTGRTVVTNDSFVAVVRTVAWSPDDARLTVGGDFMTRYVWAAR